MNIEFQLLPTDPSDACIFISKWLVRNRKLFARGNEPLKSRAADFFRNVRVLEIAALKTDDPDGLGQLIDEVRYANDSYEAASAFEALDRVEDLIHDIKLEAHFSGKGDQFGTATFSLEKAEIQRIMKKTSEMRTIISKSEAFDAAHRKRLLDRISQVEAEIYRKDGKIDAILGGIVDFGDALGKFGNSVKPLVDRMAEVRKIVQSKTAAYKELPAPEETKKLPPPVEE